MSDPKRRPHITAIVIAVVSAGAAGAVCAALAIAPIVPPSLKAGVEPEEVPITMSDFSDPLPATLLLETGQAVNIVAPSAGRVTSFACARGARLTSGGTFLAVSGTPILTLASSVPPWRSLTWGDEGADVESIRAEMLRLGAPASTPGVLDDIDTDAFSTLLQKIGATDADGVIDLGSVLWTPRDGAVVMSCATTIGELVTEGQTIATLDAPLNRVTVASLPTSVRDGDRELVLDDVHAPVTLTDGATSEPAVLGAIQSAPSYQRLLLSDGDKTQIAATYSLTTPLKVASVPAGSIFGVVESSGCVAAKGSPIKVEILGSQLGQTYVSFPEGSTPTHIERSPDGSTACR